MKSYWKVHFKRVCTECGMVCGLIDYLRGLVKLLMNMKRYTNVLYELQEWALDSPNCLVIQLNCDQIVPATNVKLLVNAYFDQFALGCVC